MLKKVQKSVYRIKIFEAHLIGSVQELINIVLLTERWQNVKPRAENVMTPFNDSIFERTGYLTCDCFPSCTDITYNVKTSSIPLSLSELLWGR